MSGFIFRFAIFLLRYSTFKERPADGQMGRWPAGLTERQTDKDTALFIELLYNKRFTMQFLSIYDSFVVFVNKCCND
jgi:hypothetical protein